MTEACSVVGNRDVEPFVPTLIGAMLRPAETTEAIHKLGAVTFVQVIIAFPLSSNMRWSDRPFLRLKGEFE